MYMRVAHHLADGDTQPGHAFFDIMSSGRMLPNSPTLRNAGTDRGGYSACYVLPIEDSLDSILDTVHDMAVIHKAFGGTGFDFSKLRAAGAPIQSTGGKACGPEEVLKLLNQTSETVKQGGIRAGGNMAVISVRHPDVRTFITAKQRMARKMADGTDGVHFNISVSVDDEFMRAATQTYAPDAMVTSETELLQYIATTAHATGCPGMLFLDRINADNWCPKLGRITATNPCGEQPLPAYGSCNLGSVDLGKFVHQNDFDMDSFTRTIHDGVNLLDAVIDRNRYPLPKVENLTKQYRPIGLGVMGWADALIKLGVSWCSNDALNWIDKIGKEYQRAAQIASVELAEVHGPYPAWEEGCGQSYRRNACLTTIAPTGTLRMLAGCNEGIEPVYDWDVSRVDESGQRTSRHHLYDLAKAAGLLRDTALNIEPIWHIKHQARWQLYVDNAVSKTINMPSTATPADIYEVYVAAWRMDCKGITVYRDKSKEHQVMTSVDQRTTMDIHSNAIERFGTTLDFPSGCGDVHVTCNNRDRDGLVPYEAYGLASGGCKALIEGLGRVCSKYIHDPRLAGDETATVERIVDTLSQVVCTTAAKSPRSAGKSCPDIIAKRMAAVWLKGTRGRNGKVRVDVGGARRCPECGSQLSFGAGCGSGTCDSCGWSGCS